MVELFLNLLNMSISASWLILAVILVRALLGNAPKNFRYVLWTLVAFRLLCPFSLESSLSLIPSGETVPENIIHSQVPQINSGVDAVDEVFNPILSKEFTTKEEDTGNLNQIVSVENQVLTGEVEAEANADSKVTASAEKTQTYTPVQIIIYAANTVWLVGIFAMLVYTIVSYIGLWKKVQISVPIHDNVWLCDGIQSPFILGIIRPRIYLPSYMQEEQIPYVIAHEKQHLRCFDHLWKPFGFVVLAIHWFNPLVWAAYILMSRDIELACDERVIRNMDAKDKRSYTEVLLVCSSPRHMITACPVAFGEIGVKARMKKIVKNQKPTIWIITAAVLACVIIGACFMTNPKSNVLADEANSALGELLQNLKPEETQTDEAREVRREEYEYYADLNHDGTRYKISLSAMTIEDTSAEIELSVFTDKGLRIYTETKEQNAEYYLLSIDGKDYLLTHTREKDAYGVEGWYGVYSFEENQRKFVETNRVDAFYADAHNLDKEEWKQYAKTLNEYLENADLLAGISDGEIIHDEVDTPTTNREQFHWLIEGEADKEASMEETLDTFIAQSKAEYPEEPREVIYETTADLNHDDMEDLVQLVVYSLDYDFTVDSAANVVYVRVYKGMEDGTYSSDECYRSEYCSASHSANGTYVLTEKYGKDYLMYSVLDEAQGIASYRYEVFSLGTADEVVVKEQKSMEFYTEAWMEVYYWNAHREDVVPVMKEAMTPWIENGVVLVALDCNSPLFVSVEGAECPAADYYNAVWERKDDASLLNELEAAVGDEAWKQYLYVASENTEYAKWLEEELESDYSEWFEDYNGERYHIINHHADGSMECTMSQCCDIIYFNPQQPVLPADAVEMMLWKLLEARTTKADNRTYTIGGFQIPEHSVLQVSENMWLVRYLDAYYAYEGTDIVTYEERLKYETDVEVGLVPLLRDGKSEDYWYILIEEDGIYRMERFQNMYQTATQQ